MQSILAMMQFDMGGKIDLVSKRFCQCFHCHESTKRALDGIFTRSEGTKVVSTRYIYIDNSHASLSLVNY